MLFAIRMVMIFSMLFPLCGGRLPSWDMKTGLDVCVSMLPYEGQDQPADSLAFGNDANGNAQEWSLPLTVNIQKGDAKPFAMKMPVTANGTVTGITYCGKIVKAGLFSWTLKTK